MPSRTVVLPNPTGLHARPAKVFAQAAGAAAASGATVTLSKGAQRVNARSVLSVLTLDCHQGDEVTISVEGDGADQVLASLVELVESGLGESEPSPPAEPAAPAPESPVAAGPGSLEAPGTGGAAAPPSPAEPAEPGPERPVRQGEGGT